MPASAFMPFPSTLVKQQPGYVSMQHSKVRTKVFMQPGVHESAHQAQAGPHAPAASQDGLVDASVRQVGCSTACLSTLVSWLHKSLRWDGWNKESCYEQYSQHWT